MDTEEDRPITEEKFSSIFRFTVKFHRKNLKVYIYAALQKAIEKP
jgi:hypothetical protein